MPMELDGQLMFGEAAEIIRQGEREKYTAFVDKFKPSKTTDDCYTPQPVMDAVNAWVEKEYGISRERFVRPFWPGGDYQAFDYPDGCAVVDNPPFSILSGIVRWYVGRGIRFFQFAPALTLFNQRGNSRDVTYIAAGADVIYENGANVRTSFITNLDTWQLRTAPELTREVTRISRELASQDRKELPKYVYPDAVITAARCQWMSEHGVDYRLGKEDAVFISMLDAQQAQGKSIFGGGFLMSERAAAERAAADRAAAERAAADRAAAERAAAERAAAERWQLSGREKAMQAQLNN